MRTIKQYTNFKKRLKVWEFTFDDVIFPTIQRIAARTLAQDIVSVQPMGAPIGIINNVDVQYETVSEPTFPFWKIKVIFNK